MLEKLDIEWDYINDEYYEMCIKYNKPYKKISYEIANRDITNIYCLLKEYNEDMQIEYLLKKDLIEFIYFKYLNIKVRGGFLKYITTFKNIYQRRITPVEEYIVFKPNKNIRKIKIPLINSYIVFIINTLLVFEDFYLQMNTIVNNLNSVVLLNPILTNNTFNESGYEHLENTFTTTIDRVTNLKEQLKISSEYTSYMYLDIENFYNSIYIHDIERLKNKEIYDACINSLKHDYIKFIHDYNMSVNNSETRGIITGPLSSKITAELLLLPIDVALDQFITESKLNIKYTRYLDDYTFYGKTMYELDVIKKQLMKLLLELNLKVSDAKMDYGRGLSKKHIEKESVCIPRYDVSEIEVLYMLIDFNSYIVKENALQNNKNINHTMRKHVDHIIGSYNSGVENILHNLEKCEVLITTVNFIIQITIENPSLARYNFRHIEKLLIYFTDEHWTSISNQITYYNEIIDSNFEENTLISYLFKKHFLNETNQFNIDIENLFTTISNKGKLNMNLIGENPLFASLYLAKKWSFA